MRVIVDDGAFPEVAVGDTVRTALALYCADGWSAADEDEARRLDRVADVHELTASPRDRPTHEAVGDLVKDERPGWGPADRWLIETPSAVLVPESPHPLVRPATNRVRASGRLGIAWPGPPRTSPAHVAWTVREIRLQSVPLLGLGWAEPPKRLVRRDGRETWLYAAAPRDPDWSRATEVPLQRMRRWSDHSDNAWTRYLIDVRPASE